jgi:ketosteroid isomerase-like protein
MRFFAPDLGENANMGSGTRDTVVRWLQARSRRDFARLAALTAADARWESPVAGTTVGRDAVVRNVKDGFEDSEQFASEILALECRGDRAVAVVHNTGRRQQEALDSLQTLFLRVDGGVIAEVKVAVDDEQTVEAFWADEPNA